MKLLITGGAGFIGSNFIHYIFKKYQKYQILNLDKLTYAGNLDNLKDIEGKPQYQFVKGDITDFKFINKLIFDTKPDVIVNFAAESHNSYAILNPSQFFKTNTLGTQILLEAARQNKTRRFHHISTCEVYGDLPLNSQDKFNEYSPYRPNTPYSASKAAADLIVRAYFKTFGMAVTISNCCNNYGPYQFPEKLIPLFITNLFNNEYVPIYKNSQHSREWLHVFDHCQAIDLILKKGKIGETYNIGSGIEKSIEEISQILLKKLKKSAMLKKYVPDRPGHDRRYLLDSSKIQKELKWKPEISFEKGIEQVIQWYKDNRSWWKLLKKRRIIQEDKWNKTEY